MTKEEAKTVIDLLCKEYTEVEKEDVKKVIDMIDDPIAVSYPCEPNMPLTTYTNETGGQND